jgi:hypothetical protein
VCGGVWVCGCVGCVGCVGGVGVGVCGRCGGVGSLLTFDIPQTALVATLDTYDFICYDFVARLGRSAHAAKTPNQHALFVSKSILSKSKQTLPFCCRTRYSSALHVVPNKNYSHYSSNSFFDKDPYVPVCYFWPSIELD